MSENTKAELDVLLDSFLTYPPWIDSSEPTISSWDAANNTFCESSSALCTLPSDQPVVDRHLHEPSIHTNGVNMNDIHVNGGSTSDVVHQSVHMNGGNTSNFVHRSVQMNGGNASDFMHQSVHMNGGNTSDFMHHSVHMNGGNTSDFLHESVHMNCGNTVDFVHQDLQQGPNQYYHQSQISVLAYQENAVDNRQFPVPGTSEQFDAENGYMTGTNNTEPLVYSQPLEQSHPPQLPAMWQSNYMTVPPLQMDQVNMQNFGLQGEYVPNNATDILGTSYPDAELLQPAVLPRCHNNLQEQDMHSHTSLTADPPVNNIPKNGYFHPHPQLPQFGDGNVVGQCTNHYPVAQQQAAQANGNGPPNGAPKPRVRARRGQATDPHSIAERLRREKIADRMKNLQELVPNSTKADKASMLDEIIDYVKFLQLQVKVLSTSRVSKKDAPLVTDLQHEEVDNYQSLPSSELGGDDSDSDDYAAFEQEVVKLMESDVTTAMQILQNKGLCLMPTTLATAIANKKGSVAAIPPNKRKDAHPPVNSQNNETTTQSNDRGNGCNGAVVKQENLQRSSGNGRLL